MPTVFEKLNLKDETTIVVLDAPVSFESELAALRDVRVARDFAGATPANFALAFATTQAALNRSVELVVANVAADAKLWFAYPKQTSKRYTCDFNRDSGWDALHAAGYETVRQIAIDEDWSALRFRQTQHVKSRARSADPR